MAVCTDPTRWPNEALDDKASDEEREEFIQHMDGCDYHRDIDESRERKLTLTITRLRSRDPVTNQNPTQLDITGIMTRIENNRQLLATFSASGQLVPALSIRARGAEVAQFLLQYLPLKLTVQIETPNFLQIWIPKAGEQGEDILLRGIVTRVDDVKFYGTHNIVLPGGQQKLCVDIQPTDSADHIRITASCELVDPNTTPV